MSFFDSKEEVLKIELTPYGKKLLLEGKFKPSYYTFHDDDVIYDTAYANGKQEIQLSSSVRILNETPYLKPQARFTSVENTSRKLSPLEQKSDTGLFTNLLANMSLNSDYKPAWNINILKGQAESFDKKYANANKELDIPQINLKPIFYDIILLKKEDEKLPDDIIFSDGTAYRFVNNYAFFNIEELNVDFEKEAFQIELFEVKDDGNGGEDLEQIYFKKQKEIIVNDILLDDSEIKQENINQDLILADNYFNILVDDEIDLEQVSTEVGVKLSKTVKPPFGEDC
jgi:hypothetical protein